MICPNCHKDIPSSSDFCPYCGAKVSSRPTLNQATHKGEWSNGVANPNNGYILEKQYTEEEKNAALKKSAIITGIGLIPALVCFIGGLLFLLVADPNAEISYITYYPMIFGGMVAAIVLLIVGGNIGSRVIPKGQYAKGKKEQLPGVFIGLGVMLGFLGVFLMFMKFMLM